MKIFATFLSGLFLLACTRADAPVADQHWEEHVAAEETPVVPEEAPSGAEAVLEDGARLFGAELSEREPLALTALIESPAEYDGQIVQTVGTISAVCERMGCWMEMKADEDGPAIRVPMAGHSFFLPRDVSGARATVEGTVEVAELPADWQEHLEGEGAQAADQTLAISATGVLIHPS
jgi:hypothetical protein